MVGIAWMLFADLTWPPARASGRASCNRKGTATSDRLSPRLGVSA